MVGKKVTNLRLLFLISSFIARWLQEGTGLLPVVAARRSFFNGRRHGGVNRCTRLGPAESQIRQYLESRDGGEFYIQGWRWHTMSLAREASRLNKLAQKVLSDQPSAESELAGLKDAADYVVEFNMKGLHKIEKDLFFPWVRKKVGSFNDMPATCTAAFKTLMDRLDTDRQSIESHGRSLNKAAKVASNPAIDEKKRIDNVRRMISESEAIVDCANSMLELEDNLLVPVIARVVPAPEQKSFNDKVIRKLGILDSRLHLVGMHEAVIELNNKEEQELFRTSIPKIPQMMIPRWKRLLYEPRVGVLDKAYSN